MASDGSHDSSPDRRLDARALRFALIFAALLAAALILGSVLIAGQLPDGVVFPWGGSPVSIPVFLTVGVAAILVLGAGVGSQGARTSLPRNLRRVLLGVAMTLQLSAFTLFVATLLGQGQHEGLPTERVDGFVLLMGCGLAASMGVVLALTFKPDEQWTPADDSALLLMLESELDPDEAKDQLSYFLHPRSSIVLMILLAAVLPGAFLALISPWIFLAMVLAALLVIALLCATVSMDRTGLEVKVLGLVPVLTVPCLDVAAAVSLDIMARDYGGWGPRRHNGSVTFLSYSGAAVVLRLADGGQAAVSAPSLDLADELSAIMNRRAGKSPGDRSRRP
ncbi:hypothetical protein CVS30_11705 [Arthrobacter psychrolactophilus]|uniref:DUF1648 domain-containing protein n=1 Tax=Arthrobacter psychrolactophilus TaxID=92442 RepID=A0A2V5IQ90_9MICC|nr:hypothetical protein [Arthrobacter psychrolactophilus]PYI38211.1 hypothetical protein CVS30_11705 [Arthrobacter psychrolactophilus]